MKYGIDIGRGLGKSVVQWVEARRDLDGLTYTTLYIDEMVDWNTGYAKALEKYKELYEGARLPGKTPDPRSLLKRLRYEQSRYQEREAAEDLRPRWLSVRILQLTGLDAHARSLTTQIAFPWHHGRAAGKAARLQELSDRLPELQLITSDEVRSRILFGRSSEDWRALGRYLAASEGLPTKETQ